MIRAVASQMSSSMPSVCAVFESVPKSGPGGVAFDCALAEISDCTRLAGPGPHSLATLTFQNM